MSTVINLLIMHNKWLILIHLCFYDYLSFLLWFDCTTCKILVLYICHKNACLMAFFENGLASLLRDSIWIYSVVMLIYKLTLRSLFNDIWTKYISAFFIFCILLNIFWFHRKYINNYYILCFDLSNSKHVCLALAYSLSHLFPLM